MLKNIFYFLIIIGFILIPITANAQEFTVKKSEEELKKEKEIQKEDDYLKFQHHFFNALQLKSANNYQKAIEELEECKQIYPNNEGMNFEFAKNYLQLKDYENSVFFANKVLVVKQDISVYEHLKKTFKIQRNFVKAIEIQYKIIALNPKKESDLIQLYIVNKQKDKAKKLFLSLEEKRKVINYKSYFQRVLFPSNQETKIENRPKKNSNSFSIQELQKQFTSNSSFNFLKKLLEKELLLQQFKDLETDANKGLELFPAQPVIYIMLGKAENGLLKYNKALETLELGLDFIIDNTTLEREFYLQISLAHINLRNAEKAAEFKEKANNLLK